MRHRLNSGGSRPFSLLVDPQEPDKTVERKRPAGGQYLTFDVAEETYAIPIAAVLEIFPLLKITRIPRAPEAVLGVINLRGKVVPVFDMHIKLGIPQAEATRNTCVIVVNVGGADRGLVVDCVREVADLRGDEIEPPPAFEDGVPSEHLVGIATAGGHTLLLLALPQFLATNRVAEAPEAPEAPEAAAAEAAAAVEATEAARDDFAA